MDYIKVGTIVNTFGLKGELKIKDSSDFVEERFKAGQQLYIFYKKEYLPVIVNSKRVHKGFLLVAFKDMLDINLVEKYKNCDLFVKKDDIAPLSKGQYYQYELKGCDVYYNDSKFGEVTSVEPGYQTVLRINHENKDILVPYVDAFVKNVNIENHRIDINVIEGML